MVNQNRISFGKLERNERNVDRRAAQDQGRRGPHRLCGPPNEYKTYLPEFTGLLETDFLGAGSLAGFGSVKSGREASVPGTKVWR
jgi:hypothetical protein